MCRNSSIGRNHGCFDKPNGANGVQNLAVLDTVLGSWPQGFQRHDLIQPQNDDVSFKPQSDAARLSSSSRLHWSCSPAIRDASARGMVSSRSARSKVRKPSSASRSLRASTTNSNFA